MNKIAEYRKNAGLTQVQLADYLGISQNTLSQYETGKRKPDVKTIEMLAEYFSVSVNKILNIDEPPADIPSDKPALWSVRQIKVVQEEDECNLLLSAGWKLLHVGEIRTVYEDGSSSSVIYTLGWTGNLRDAKEIASLDPSSRRHYGEWGWQ